MLRTGLCVVGLMGASLAFANDYKCVVEETPYESMESEVLTLAEDFTAIQGNGYPKIPCEKLSEQDPEQFAQFQATNVTIVEAIACGSTPGDEGDIFVITREDGELRLIMPQIVTYRCSQD